MLILFETPAGYALFKVVDKGKLQNVDAIHKEFATPESAKEIVKLKDFSKFKDTTEALAAACAISDGKLSKPLKKFLSKAIVDKGNKRKLGIADLKLGGLISKKLEIKCVHDTAVAELMRGIRSQMEALLGGVPAADLKAMKLGLSHSLCRYKLKFSPDKVDTMIIQAIALLDELDKELNTYSMRVKEWYGWHFPEMAKIVSEPLLYSRIVKVMGIRKNAATCDLSDILEEEVENDIKYQAEISMGTEVADEDIENIQELCDQVISISNYRTELYNYLKNRMQAMAPNLTHMVGELVGARLIAHAGSLLHLAKAPASTVQILGAEKALFRALKAKTDTPKYGLIFHASLIGQAQAKHKGKISRVLAAKTSLAVRIDALGETEGLTCGLQYREKVENRIRQLEMGKTYKSSGSGRGFGEARKYEKPAALPKQYNPALDVTMKPKVEPMVPAEESEAEKKKKKKEKKKRKREQRAQAEAESASAEEKPAKKKKKKKKKKQEETSTGESESPDAENGEKKKKKKKKKKKEEETTSDSKDDSGEEKKKKKKKKKKKSD